MNVKIIAYILIIITILLSSASLILPSISIKLLPIFIKVPHPLTQQFLIKLKLLQITIIIFSLAILILTIKFPSFFTDLFSPLKSIIKQHNSYNITFTIMTLFSFVPIFVNIIDLEAIVYHIIINPQLQAEKILLPNDAIPADLYLPTDFKEFILKTTQITPENSNILYLGVEKDIANYFLYPRKLFQPPDYQWLFLSTETISTSQFCKEKKIQYIIRKYRPKGFKIDKIKQ